MYRNIDLIRKLLPKLKQPLYQVKSEEHLKLAKSMEKSNLLLFRICLYIVLQTYIIYSVIPFISKEKRMLTKGWFPFDWTVSPYYETVYVFQNVVALWNCFTLCNMDTFTYGLLMFLRLQCDFLCLDLNNMSKLQFMNNKLTEVSTSTAVRFLDEEDRRNFSAKICEKLIVCIQHYKEIKR